MVLPEKFYARSLICAAVSLAMCGAANATTVYSGSLSLTSSAPTQLGRLSRNGIPSDWSMPSPFPGVINPTTVYHYTTLDLDLAALESPFGAFGSYVQISIDSTPATTFLSAYLGSYNPNSLSTNYLGDPGTSANYFGTDPLFFQVVAPRTPHLILVLNESTTNGGLNLPLNVTVEAFSDTEFTDLAPAVAAVPEPSTWALFAAGLALLAGGRPHRRRAENTASRATELVA